MNKNILKQLKNSIETDSLEHFKQCINAINQETGYNLKQIDQSVLNKNKSSFFVLLASSHAYNILQYLTEDYLIENEPNGLPIDYTDKKNNTALYYLTHPHNQWLNDQWSENNFDNNKNNNKANSKVLNIAQYFIKNGASLYHRNNKGESVLSNIIKNNKIPDDFIIGLNDNRSIFWFLKSKQNTKTEHNGANYLNQNNSTYMVELLLNRPDGFKHILETLDDSLKNQFLHDKEPDNIIKQAIQSSNVGCDHLDLLLQHANMDWLDTLYFKNTAKNNTLSTLLMLGVESGNKDKVETLLHHNPKNINILNHNEETALLLSIKNEYFDIAELLLDYDADIFSKNFNNEDVFYNYIEEIKYTSNADYYNIVDFIQKNKSNKEKIWLNSQTNKHKNVFIESQTKTKNNVKNKKKIL